MGLLLTSQGDVGGTGVEGDAGDKGEPGFPGATGEQGLKGAKVSNCNDVRTYIHTVRVQQKCILLMLSTYL